MHVFFSPEIKDNRVTLDETESGHAVRVLRLKAGDEAVILDGQGHKAYAVLADPHPKHSVFLVEKMDLEEKRKPHLHIAIAPTKLNDRTEWFLEKATEIGVNEISPVICHRSERKVVNHERFHKVIVSATKQSMNLWMPVLNEQITMQEFLKKTPPGYIAHCLDGEKINLRDAEAGSGAITILIGPEGDFTPEEVGRATELGWKPLSLGSSRLRTETAALVACTGIRLLM